MNLKFKSRGKIEKYGKQRAGSSSMAAIKIPAA